MNNLTSFAEPAEQKDGTQPHRKTILFVCTGNTCRSPMCAALFNALFSENRTVHADSCGLFADGSPISANAVSALMNRGITPTGDNDYRAHISKPVTEELMEQADMVVGITHRHAMELMFRYPAYATKIHVMPLDIADPYGGNLAAYEACLADIETSLSEAFPKDRKINK